MLVSGFNNVSSSFAENFLGYACLVVHINIQAVSFDY